MLLSADWAEQRLKEADIVSITALFFVLVLLAATQDIAVDGWALTLLSRPHIGWVDPQTRGASCTYHPAAFAHVQTAASCCAISVALCGSGFPHFACLAFVMVPLICRAVQQ